jgi:hypothetical protein
MGVEVQPCPEESTLKVTLAKVSTAARNPTRNPGVAEFVP